MNHTNPKVYVVTLNWNHADDTIACLESLLKLDYPNVELVLCDNASRSESVQRIREWAMSIHTTDGTPGLREYDNATATAGGPPSAAARLTLIHTGANLGFAGGMNPGVRYAMARGDADYVWLLNNDTEVPIDALTHLVARMQDDSAIGICGSTLIEGSDRSTVQAWGGSAYKSWRARSIALGAFTPVAQIPDNPADVEARMGYVVGASMLVSRRYLEVVGLMDESFFLYSEEHDWAYRGMKKGFRLGYAPRSLVYHAHGATIGTDPGGGSPLSLFYLFRAKAMFAARHHRAFLPVVLASLVFEASKLLVKGYPDKCIAALRGIVAWPRRKMFA